jgi:SAM-dependent methyltransferase
MDAEAMEPYGLALTNFFGGERSATLIIRRDDGYADDLPVSHYFREPPEFSAIEEAALARCRGRVLDVGAGAGCHSLVLQDRGLPVTAVDVCPQAVDIMVQRGVREARVCDVFEYRGGPFDTVLMMDHGIGLVEHLSGLARFLGLAHQLVAPRGRILCDSMDVRSTDVPSDVAYQEANRRAGRYIGEIRTQLTYAGRSGPFFGWLQVDPQTLSEHAIRTGWLCRVFLWAESGDYLAQLTPSVNAQHPPQTVR